LREHDVPPDREHQKQAVVEGAQRALPEPNASFESAILNTIANVELRL
jgi:hypothetical protein